MPRTHNTLVTEGWDGYNVLAVTFRDDSNAYNAMTLLKELDSQHRVGVEEAIVAVRTEDGQVIEKDRIESISLPSSAGGGAVGVLIGLLGGVPGVLIGGTTGLLVGSLVDIHDVEETESALSSISRAIAVGRPTLLTVVVEQSPDVLDAAMASLGGTVLRRSVADVEAEIDADDDEQRKAAWRSRKASLRTRQQRDKEDVRAKIGELKEKLDPGRDA